MKTSLHGGDDATRSRHVGNAKNSLPFDWGVKICGLFSGTGEIEEGRGEGVGGVRLQDL